MSTRFPHDQSPSSPQPTTPPAGFPGDARHPQGPHRDRPHDRPVGRGERRAWNTATAVVGGVGALALLLGGAGTATALALTQERDGSWRADSAISSIRIDAPTSVVDVSTSPTVDRVQVQWHETGWAFTEQPLAPEVSGGALTVRSSPERQKWGSTSRQISVIVPQDAPAASLNLTSTTGAVNLKGTFKDVSARTEIGSITATDVEASVLDARATTGQVLLNGVRVSNRLDAHATLGMALVEAQGTAPERASVTASTGAYGVDMTEADYWYPKTSRHDVADPRRPRTATAGDEPRSSAEPWTSPTAGSSPHGETARAALDADTVCASAPKNRPCLFLEGTPVDVRTSGYMDEWNAQWDQDSDTRAATTPAPQATRSAAREH